MTIYIAGQMAGLPRLGRNLFTRAENRLRGQGHVVLNPASLPVGLAPTAYMPICLAMIDAADAVYLLSNWRRSAGAQLEAAYARYQKKPLYQFDTHTGTGAPLPQLPTGAERCPDCGGKSKTVDSHVGHDGLRTRLRACQNCGTHWTTTEVMGHKVTHK